MLRRSVEPTVKTGKALCEHMFSAVHPITDITKLERHVRKVPKGDVMYPLQNVCFKAEAELGHLHA